MKKPSLARVVNAPPPVTFMRWTPSFGRLTTIMPDFTSTSPLFST